jgi:lactoylglutathione lyase
VRLAADLLTYGVFMMCIELSGAARIDLRGIRILHTMLRVTDLERSLRFYTQALGMHLLRRENYPTGRFTLLFLGFGAESSDAVLELTHNWDISSYERGTAFGHIAIGVRDLRAICDHLHALGVTILRAPGPMNHISTERTEAEQIAFIEDPDGYRIELIQEPHAT